MTNQVRTRSIEYYRCWAGNSGDSGTWDTDFVTIPADTPDDQIDRVVREAVEKIQWRNEPPVLVGVYSVPPIEDDDVTPEL